MQTVTITAEAGAALETVAGRIADLLSSLPDTRAPIPGLDWTVREAAAHLANYSGIYAEIANGAPSPVQAPVGDGAAYGASVAANSVQRLADLPETDPARLARLVLDGAGGLIDTTCGRPDEQPVSFHCGFPFTIAGLVCTSLSEHLVHGYDIASAVGAPWPIDPAHAGLALWGVSPLFALCVNRQTTAGLSAAYEIELRGVGRSVVRFVDGVYGLEPPDSGAVDCVISADPVAYLLVGARRLSQWSAIALGLLSASGPRPELALGFGDLFIYP
jgi:uncharacterized protein (TIGR03083 family)